MLLERSFGSEDGLLGLKRWRPLLHARSSESLMIDVKTQFVRPRVEGGMVQLWGVGRGGAGGRRKKGE